MYPNSLQKDHDPSLQRELNEFVTGVMNNRHLITFNAKALLTYLLGTSYPNSSLDNTANNMTEQQITCYPNKNADIQHLATITENQESKFLDASAPIFVPTPSPPSSPICAAQENYTMRRPKRSKCKRLFAPTYPARAQLNIYIGKDLTFCLLNDINETFPSAETLYYYIDISTALQINDLQMHIFTIDNSPIMFVNYDLHSAESQDILYGVIALNEGHKIKQNKWIWKLYHFMTANEIYERFGVCYNELPLSSRRMNTFQKQLETQRELFISERIVDFADWNNIQQIKSLKRCRNNRNYNRKINIVVKLNKKRWIQQCKKSWFECPSIPIVINENKNNVNTHWIEWIKLIRINDNECMQMVGVSCRYLQSENKWIITSINLDKGDILNKHRLVGLNANSERIYVKYFDFFNTTFTEIQWIKSN